MIEISDVIEEYLNNEYVPTMTKLQNFENKIKTIILPTELKKFKGFYVNLDKLSVTVRGLNLKLDAKELSPIIEKKFEASLEAYQDKEHEIHKKYSDLIDMRKNNLKSEAELHNNSVTEEWAASNQQYMKLEEKRKALASYSDVIQDVCDMYGIVSSDCNISEEDYTVESLNKEYDKYLSFLQKKSKASNPITVLREKVPNVQIQCLIIVIALIACFTPLLDVAAIIFYFIVAVKQSGMKRVVGTYAKIYALINNVQPLNMGYRETVEDALLEETDIDDEDERLDDLVEEWESKLDDLDKENPEDELNAAKAELASQYNTIQQDFGNKMSEFAKRKNALFNSLVQMLDAAKKNEEVAKSKLKYLCDRFNKGYVLDTKFALGLTDNVEEFVDIGERNVVIRPGSNPELYQKFMYAMVANAFLNVKRPLMDITVIDPVFRCKDFMAFYQPELTSPVLHLNESDFSTVIQDMLKFMDKNMKEMRGLSISEYNKRCQETNAAPREYRLLILASNNEKFLEDSNNIGLMKTSARNGLLIWLITDNDISDIQDSVTVFSKPFDKVITPYPIDIFTFPDKFIEGYKLLKESSALPPLTFDSFMKQTVPEDHKWWNRQKLAKTDKRYKEFDNDIIQICPGYYEGNPAKADTYAFGHKGDVHMLGVGGTGAGKSVFLNFVILYLCTVYSPQELELWLVDFKGAEFQKYMASKLNGFKALPHVKACLCTSDGDYAGSLYRAFADDSRHRYDLFKKVGCNSLKEYNAKMTMQGHPEKRLPRVLMINDEFQVIFQQADPGILEKIKVDMTYIAKVGRASGHHLLFTSQSMNKTLSADILDQFTLRFVLRCSLSTSQDILGNKAAGLIKEANGFLYVRSSDNDFVNNPPRYRTPFISEDRPTDDKGNETGELSQVEKAICKIYDEAQNIGFKQSRVLTYDENTKHSINEVNEFFDRYKDKSEELEDIILLGPSMTYTDSVAPQNIKLTPKNNRHIFSAFSNYDDLVNFYKTVYTNIQCSVNHRDFIVNTQIKDLHYLCEIDLDLDEDLQSMSTYKTDVKDFIDFVEQVYKSRVETETKDTPLYVICIGWDKARGFGVDKDSLLVSRVQSLLQLCGEYHIHFIFICTGVGKISLDVINACEYRICGKSDENTSRSIINTAQAYKSQMADGFMYIFSQEGTARAKLYQYPKTRKVKQEKLSF